MSHTILNDAIKLFREELRKNSGCGALSRSGQSRASDLPPTLDEFYQSANPDALEIPWVVEWLTLYPWEELSDAQEGFAHSVGAPGTLAPGWRSHWLVIGDASGDPIIADTSTREGLIFMAQHGTGEWAPKAVSRNIGEFLVVLTAWLTLLC